MKIGFIGAGTVTGTFGRHVLAAGHTIVVANSRGPETLADFIAELGPGAVAGTKQQAAGCDVVVLATNWVNVPQALNDIDWRGRILIDATNAHVDPIPDSSLAGVTESRAALRERTSGTSSELVAEMAVGARLVKSISNMHRIRRDRPRVARSGWSEVGAPLSGIELHFVRRLSR